MGVHVRNERAKEVALSAIDGRVLRVGANVRGADGQVAPRGPKEEHAQHRLVRQPFKKTR